LGPLALGMGGGAGELAQPTSIYKGGPRPHVYSIGVGMGGPRPQVFSSGKYITEYPIDIKYKYLWYNVK
jgi:hypothetical protein